MTPLSASGVVARLRPVERQAGVDLANDWIGIALRLSAGPRVPHYRPSIEAAESRQLRGERGVVSPRVERRLGVTARVPGCSARITSQRRGWRDSPTSPVGRFHVGVSSGATKVRRRPAWWFRGSRDNRGRLPAVHRWWIQNQICCSGRVDATTLRRGTEPPNVFADRLVNERRHRATSSTLAKRKCRSASSRLTALRARRGLVDLRLSAVAHPMFNKVLPNELANDLRWREVLQRTEVFKRLLLVRVDENRQTCRLLFHQSGSAEAGNGNWLNIKLQWHMLSRLLKHNAPRTSSPDNSHNAASQLKRGAAKHQTRR